MSLLQYQLHGSILLVWRILILTQNSLHHQPQLGTHTLTLRPVHRQIFAQAFRQLMRNFFHGLIAEFPHRRLVISQGIIEADFILRQSQLLTTTRNRTELLRHLDQLFDDLSSFNGAVLIALDDITQQLRKFLFLHHVAHKAALNFTFQ